MKCLWKIRTKPLHKKQTLIALPNPHPSKCSILNEQKTFFFVKVILFRSFDSERCSLYNGIYTGIPEYESFM